MTDTSANIEIPLSKKKLILMLIGSIGFVILGLWFVIEPPIISNSFFGNPAALFVVGIAAVLFFGLCAIYIARKLFDNSPGLVIDNVGLTDNSSGASAGRILWSDIERLSVLQIHRQKLIMLDVKNPHEYIDRQKSGFKKKMMQMNFKMYGTPLSITSNTLQIEFDELLNILEERINSNRQ